jgi:hypothetical protein
MKITGKISNKYKTAIQFFADKMLSKQMQQYVSVRFSFVKDFEYLGLTHVYGYNSKDKPREFVIEVCREQTERELTMTLAHEMIHVKQYAYGELNEEMTKWKGQTVCPRSIEYDNQPWEIEAETQAEELCNEYEKSRRISK